MIMDRIRPSEYRKIKAKVTKVGGGGRRKNKNNGGWTTRGGLETCEREIKTEKE